MEFEKRIQDAIQEKLSSGVIEEIITKKIDAKEKSNSSMQGTCTTLEGRMSV